MKRYFTSSALCLGLLAAVGCSSGNKDDVSYGYISGHLTPEMKTMSERPVDLHRHNSVVNNQNYRNFWADLGRTFYTDHPSMLSPYPTARTSGVAR